jgi:hypothetical protein
MCPLGHKLAIAEDLKAFFDSRKIQSKRRGVSRGMETKSEPGQLGFGGIALGGPTVFRMEDWPAPVVEAGLRPIGVIAEVKAPRRINLGDGNAASVEVKCLRVRRVGGERANAD